jgi:hypothetical protein
MPATQANHVYLLLAQKRGKLLYIRLVDNKKYIYSQKLGIGPMVG